MKCVSFYSGAMEPSFYGLGDLVLSTNYDTEPIRAGDVVVFEIEGRSISIIHRVIKVHQK